MRARGFHQQRLTRLPFLPHFLYLFYLLRAKILVRFLLLYTLFMGTVIITISAHISITFPLPSTSVHKELIGNSFWYHIISYFPVAPPLGSLISLSITWLSGLPIVGNAWLAASVVYSFNGISFDLRPAGWQITMWTIHETAQKVEMRLIMHKGLHGTNS